MFSPARLSTSDWMFTDAPETRWWLLHNVFRNGDGTDSNRTQDGVLTRLPGARAELKFRGMWLAGCSLPFCMHELVLTSPPHHEQHHPYLSSATSCSIMAFTVYHCSPQVLLVHQPRRPIARSISAASPTIPSPRRSCSSLVAWTQALNTLSLWKTRRKTFWISSRRY